MADWYDNGEESSGWYDAGEWGSGEAGQSGAAGAFDPATADFPELEGAEIPGYGSVTPDMVLEPASWLFRLKNAMDVARRYALPASAVMGLLEGQRSPLPGIYADAAKAAIANAGAFGSLPAIGLMPSQERAIDLANDNVGAWQADLDQARTLTTEAAGGIPKIDINAFFNPYIHGVVEPAANAVKQAAARRRGALQSTAARSGTGSGAAGTGLLDKYESRVVDDVYKVGKADGWDRSTQTASKDLDRLGDVAKVYTDMGKSVSAFGNMDLSSLGHAGTLERKPLEDTRAKAFDTSKLYSGIIPRTSEDIASLTKLTSKPSTLSQALGAFGAYDKAKDLGIV